MPWLQGHIFYDAWLTSFIFLWKAQANSIQKDGNMHNYLEGGLLAKTPSSFYPLPRSTELLEDGLTARSPPIHLNSAPTAGLFKEWPTNMNWWKCWWRPGWPGRRLLRQTLGDGCNRKPCQCSICHVFMPFSPSLGHFLRFPSNLNSSEPARAGDIFILTQRRDHHWGGASSAWLDFADLLPSHCASTIYSRSDGHETFTLDHHTSTHTETGINSNNQLALDCL